MSIANQTLTLSYGQTKIITVSGKNAANTAIRPLTNITKVLIGGTANVTVTALGSNQFSIQNLSVGGGSDQLSWFAKNELGNDVSGSTPLVFVAADPATQIETTYSDPT